MLRGIASYIRQNALGLVAIFIALGGSAYAVGSLRKNSVGTKQLKNGAVTGKKVAKNTLTGANINASTLGTVPNTSHAGNSDQLAGLGASSYQLRVGGTCTSGAINQVNQNGGVGCAASGGPPTGPAGGDLSGTYPNPTVANGSITDAKVAAANKDGTASTPSLRTLGTGAQQAMPGNATPGGPPTGPAGGSLKGSYPNPTIAAGAIGSNELAAGSVGTSQMATLPAASTDVHPVYCTTSCTPSSPSGTQFNLCFESVFGDPNYNFDTDGLFHDDSSACAAVGQDGLKAPVAGTYVVTAFAAWAANSTGDRVLQVVNETQSSRPAIAVSEVQPVSGSGDYTQQNVVGITRLAAGDVVVAQAIQRSGSTLSLPGGNLSMTWVGR